MQDSPIISLENVDVDRMLKETGISVVEIAGAFDFPKSISPKKALEMSTTLEEIWEVYENTPKGSEIERLSLEKALEMSTTLEEVLEVYDNSLEGSEIEMLSIERLDVLLSEKLQSAITLKEVQEVYNKSPNRSEIKLEIIRKLATFFLKKKTVA